MVWSRVKSSNVLYSVKGELNLIYIEKNDLLGEDTLVYYIVMTSRPSSEPVVPVDTIQRYLCLSDIFHLEKTLTNLSLIIWHDSTANNTIDIFGFVYEKIGNIVIFQMKASRLIASRMEGSVGYESGCQLLMV